MTPGSAVATISTEPATGCADSTLNKDSRSCSPYASGQKAEHLSFKDDEGPLFGVQPRRARAGGWSSVVTPRQLPPTWRTRGRFPPVPSDNSSRSPGWRGRAGGFAGVGRGAGGTGGLQGCFCAVEGVEN